MQLGSALQPSAWEQVTRSEWNSLFHFIDDSRHSGTIGRNGRLGLMTLLVEGAGKTCEG